MFMTKYLFQCVRCRLLCSLECDNCGGLNFEKTEDELICKNCKENLISITHPCGKGENHNDAWVFGDWDLNLEKNRIPSITYYPKNKDNFFEEEECVKTNPLFGEEKWVNKEELKKEELKKEEEESKKKSWYGTPFYIILSFMFWLYFSPPSWFMPLHRLIF